MEWNRWESVQYVRLAPGVARRIAPFLNVAPEDIDELVLELDRWPATIQAAPRHGWNGILIAGDPLLLDASEAGLVFAARPGPHSPSSVLVPWSDVRSIQALERMCQEAGL